jgi:hypothetical protein
MLTDRLLLVAVGLILALAVRASELFLLLLTWGK